MTARPPGLRRSSRQSHPRWCHVHGGHMQQQQQQHGVMSLMPQGLLAGGKEVCRWALERVCSFRGSCRSSRSSTCCRG